MLRPGVRIGPYEVIALLGEGGMGKVWRARHLALGRDDAIKVLPEAFAADPERVARFGREARILASLNHQNIPPVYGLETMNGVRALIMELVEGLTLSSRLHDGPLNVRESLAIAKQIADALDAAHSRGIIHRDLKPDNVIVTAAGVAKVLDFGLAKPETEPGGATAMSTVAVGLTELGVVLGTVPYMSPEAARGLEVDKRTDIWAFGCLLYEMLTGQRAFGRETRSDVLAAILESEPDWSALPASTPPGIQRLVRRCLEKDLSRRLRDIGDARVEIEDALTPSATSSPDIGAVSASRPSWPRLAVIAGVLALIALGVGIWRRSPAVVLPETRLDVVTPPTDHPASFAISPDGRQLAFVARDGSTSKLWLRSLDDAASRPLAGTEGADFEPFWSPDGRSIGFFAGSTTKRLDLQSGAIRTLLTGPRNGAWSSEGVILLGSPLGPLRRVPESGGDATEATVLREGQTQHWYPSFLPDGRRFLFFGAVGGVTNGSGIFLGSLGSPSEARRLVSDVNIGSIGAYAPPGWLFFVRGDALLAQPFDERTGLASGEPTRVAPFTSVLTDAPAVSVSRTGVIAYRNNVGRSISELTWIDRTGKVVGTLGEPRSMQGPQVAPDSQQVLAGGLLFDGIRVTSIPGVFAARWSPDGKGIVFGRITRGRIHLYVRSSLSASDDSELLLESDQNKVPSSWSPDGRFLLFTSLDPRDGMDIWVMSMVGKHTASVWLKSPTIERSATFSPDGRFVAFQSNESGRFEIYVRPFSGVGKAPNRQWSISSEGGITPRWKSDGRELYYIAPDGTMMAVPVSTNAGGLTAGKPEALFQTRIKGGGTANNDPEYDVASDGRFLVNVAKTDPPPITVIQNWAPKPASDR